MVLCQNLTYIVVNIKCYYAEEIIAGAMAPVGRNQSPPLDRSVCHRDAFMSTTREYF